LKPVVEELKLYGQITIVPDQNLMELPFETFPYPLGNSTNKSYFIENKIISYRFSTLNRNYSKTILIPNYSEEFFGIAPFDQNDSSFHSLGGSAREIIEITNLYKSKQLPASSLVGNCATYLNFINTNLNSKILHFSTHSVINNQSIHLSFLELFRGGSQFQLYLPVLASMPLSNELLLLNACETGGNLIDSSTGFVSFVRSLSGSFIQNYICTLWKIYDEPSYSFTMGFYSKLLSGHNYSSALALTKRLFIQSNMYNYPVFWSPFILYENN
jgi:CHAT domain-containing protein